MSEVSTGSGHEADDEEEEEKDDDTPVSKIRNAINELQKEATPPEQEQAAPKNTEEETSEVKLAKKISKNNSSKDSNEDSYSFSYSDTFSADEDDEKREEDEKAKEAKESTQVLVDENKETISCRILTSDNNSIVFHPNKMIAEQAKKQESLKCSVENPLSKDSLKKDLASTAQDPRSFTLPGSHSTLNYMQPIHGNKTSKEAIQDWAKEVRNRN